ncbi:MAG: DUF4115 domain-containing protein [Hahellaceae bacterium]|nr:DUF4115 domain-containing protein [Hahellaceae bacterium]
MNESSEDANQVAVLSPGKMLRKAREEKNLSTADAANELHLRPSIVSAIEQGQYDLVPGLIFLKGYVRSYARLVGLNEAKVIAVLDEELRLKQVDVEQHNNEQQKRRRGMAGLWLVLIVALVVAAFIWRDSLIALVASGGVVEPPISSEVSTAAPEIAVESPNKTMDSNSSPDSNNSTDLTVAGTVVFSKPDSTIGMPAETQKDSTTIPLSVKFGSSEPEASVESEEYRATTSGVAGDSSAESEPDFSKAPTEDTAGAEVDSTTIVAQSAELAPVESDSTNIEAGTASLDMYFRGDSWIQITDGNGKRLVSALKRQGSEISLTGKAPFKIVVGAVSVSDVRFNGKVVDYSNFKVRNNRAVLVLE